MKAETLATVSLAVVMNLIFRYVAKFMGHELGDAAFFLVCFLWAKQIVKSMED